MRTLFLLCFLLFLSACGSDWLTGPQSATGPPEEILIVSDSTTWLGPVGDALREELAQPIATLPGTVGAFRLRYQPLSGAFFDQIKATRSVVFVGKIDDSTSVGNFLRARISEEGQQALREGTGRGIYLRENLWANNQLVTFATAASDSALIQELHNRGQELREAYNVIAETATEEEMFERGRQLREEEAMQERHGFHVKLQADYILVQDTMATPLDRSGRFIRFRRIAAPDSWRDFFVYYEENADPSVLESINLDSLTNALLETFARGTLETSFVQIDPRRPVSYDSLEIDGLPAVEKRGLWRMVDDFMGGPYVRDALYVPDRNLFVVYYGMTFAPNPRYDKRAFLRQMTIIGKTLQFGHLPEES